jgi:hypothetical protein
VIWRTPSTIQAILRQAIENHTGKNAGATWHSHSWLCRVSIGMLFQWNQILRYGRRKLSDIEVFVPVAAFSATC